MFDIARTDPDRLGPFIDDPEVDNETLEYAAIEILQERGLEKDPRDHSGVYADDDPAGEPFAEGTVCKIFPKLAAQFN